MSFVGFDFTPTDAKPFALGPKTMLVTGVVSLILIAGGIQAGWALAFSDRIYPGVRINGLDLSGMTQEEAIRTLQDTFAKQISEGLTLQVGDETTHISLDIIAEEDPDLSRSLIDADIESAVTDAYQKGRSPHLILNLLSAFLPVIERPNISIPLVIATDDIQTRILEAFPAYNQGPAPTGFLVTEEDNTWRVAVTEGEERITLGLESPLSELRMGFSQLDSTILDEPIDIPLVTLKPRVSLEEAIAMVPDVETLLDATPFTLHYTDERKRERTWDLTDDELKDMVIPTPQGVDVDTEQLVLFLEPIQEVVNVEARDAHFEADNGRAGTFIPSQNGQEVDTEATLNQFRLAILDQATEPVELVVNETTPRVALSEANDLGIIELLGTGTSSYAGSPPNRIKNIRNGVRLLNGLLVAPGEQLSLIQALKPFTFDNGYLPELVIKGDEIIPEMGGGLCQIGSTTFRATMNAGLEVAQRRNHSLVVSYYNDLSNGNPGTDATLYDPAPDYKLTNDTEHYILLEAVMDEPHQMLYFSFWGTSDGRQGSYTAPEVERWIGVGETRYIETTDIPVGTTRCQGAHPGAVASFTYNIERPDGTLDERVFSSRYRSLPQICLVGVEPEVLEEEPAEEIGVVTEESVPVAEL